MIPNMINFILYLILLITLILFSINIYVRLNDNFINLYKYKINSFVLNIIIIILYISIFIIFFYILRLYNIGNYLDLKMLYLNITLIWSTFMTPLNILPKCLLISYIIILTGLVMILLISIIKKALIELFKFYIYIQLNPVRQKKIKGLGPFWSLRDNDIISYTFHTIINKILLKYKNKDFYQKNSNYFFNILVNNKKYQLFIQFTPFLVVLYDFIFNNFVIIHFYYYMLIYIPIMLFRRITAAITNTNEGFARILWQIYYNKEKDIYYIASKEEKEIIDILLKANVGYVTEFLLEMVEFYLQGSITYRLKDAEKNIYWNNDGNCLQIIENKIFEVIEDDEGNKIFKETQEWKFL